MKNKSANLARQVSLRPVVMPDDEEFLIKVYFSTRDDVESSPLPQEQKNAFMLMQYKAQKQHYAANFPGLSYDIILLGERQIGRLMVWRNADELLVVDISLLTEFRKFGIGTILLKDLLTEAAQANLTFTLHTWKNNPAVRLYKRLGLSVTEETGTHFKMERQSPQADKK